ncbi:MAG: STAS domain-containing protein [Gammaproteobacteria bacterium]|nr:STAS domain-containing protein [Gammaproteobacteria bacterium]
MTYLVEEKDGFLLVHLEGDVDLSTSPEVRKLMLDCLRKKPQLLIDLSQVSYIDSSGVASLVEGYQLSKSQGSEFALIGVSEAARSVLQLARLDKVFPIYDSLAQRLQHGSI